MEEVSDEDAPHYEASYSEWIGEESFWLEDDEPEFELDEGEDDNTYIPFQDIKDPEGGDLGQEDDGNMEEAAFNAHTGTFVFPPSHAKAKAAFDDLRDILKLPHKNGKGYKSCSLDEVTWSHLEGVKMFIGTYIQMEKKEPQKCRNWTKASEPSVFVHG